ncbi:hypothetical protein [Streptomyces sp. SGAir0957]
MRTHCAYCTAGVGHRGDVLRGFKAAVARLAEPGDAIRVRWNDITDEDDTPYAMGFVEPEPP